jgi:hypothetical protein
VSTGPCGLTTPSAPGWYIIAGWVTVKGGAGVEIIAPGDWEALPLRLAQQTHVTTMTMTRAAMPTPTRTPMRMTLVPVKNQ